MEKKEWGTGANSNGDERGGWIWVQSQSASRNIVLSRKYGKNNGLSYFGKKHADTKRGVGATS